MRSAERANGEKERVHETRRARLRGQEKSEVRNDGSGGRVGEDERERRRVLMPLCQLDKKYDGSWLELFHKFGV